MKPIVAYFASSFVLYLIWENAETTNSVWTSLCRFLPQREYKVGELILEEHLKSCVRDAMENGNDKDRDEKLREIMAIFRKHKK
tara:strand:+ start:4602 stop:4853 length:252 start_codon:yes stop_codon:yes gene_type:complete